MDTSLEGIVEGLYRLYLIYVKRYMDQGVETKEALKRALEDVDRDWEDLKFFLDHGIDRTDAEWEKGSSI